MNRLLSNEEILEAIYHGDSADIATVYKRDRHIAKAQDAKTARELIQELEKPCTEHKVDGCNPYDPTIYGLGGHAYFCHRRVCDNCWAEIKKEYSDGK